MWDLDKSTDLQRRVGVIFFSTVFPAYMTLLEVSRGSAGDLALDFLRQSSRFVQVPAAFHRKRLVTEQLTAGLYHPMEYSAAVSFVKLPLQAACIAIFGERVRCSPRVLDDTSLSTTATGVVVYYCTAFTNSSFQAVLFWLWALLSNELAAFAIVRVVASSASSLAVTQTVAFAVVSLASMLGGVALPVSGLPTGVLWLYYASPFSWAIRR